MEKNCSSCNCFERYYCFTHRGLEFQPQKNGLCCKKNVIVQGSLVCKEWELDPGQGFMFDKILDGLEKSRLDLAEMLCLLKEELEKRNKDSKK